MDVACVPPLKTQGEKMFDVRDGNVQGGCVLFCVNVTEIKEQIIGYTF
jgi:hypothetical protein